MTLLIHHEEMLVRDRKIRPDVIAARPYFSVFKAACTQYSFSVKQSADGLMYEIHPPDNTTGLYGLRPDKPRLSKTGKKIKYEHPAGTPPRLDIPLLCHPLITDLNTDIIVTEGTTKSDSLVSNLPSDYLIVNLCNGIYGWLRKGMPIPDMNLILWTKRHVYLLFDNDVVFKPSVKFALDGLSQELVNRGATVSIVYLPLNNGQKLGVDDYFATGKTGNDLSELMRLSRLDIPLLIDEITNEQNTQQKIILIKWLIWKLADIKDVVELKVLCNLVKEKKIMGKVELMEAIKDRQDLLKANAPTQDEIRDSYLDKHEDVAYGLGVWRQYKDGIWPEIDKPLIQNDIESLIETFKPAGIVPSAGLLEGVTTLTKVKVYKPDSIWDANLDYLVCKNGVLRLSDRTLLPHDPDLWLTTGVEHDYDPNAKAPNWVSFLYDLELSLGADGKAIIEFMQEFSGYALTPDCSLETALWLHSEPGSGKSTFIEGIHNGIGGVRSGTLSLKQMSKSRFGLSNLAGKTLLMSTEQPGDYLTCDYELNAIISGETLPVERKFEDPCDIRSIAKLLFAMNELPRIPDPNSGLFRRIKVVTFPVIPESERDPKLKEDIKKEGQGILVWMLDGLDRLRNRGQFDIPQAVIDWTNSYIQTNDIPAQFLKEACWIDDQRTLKPSIGPATPQFSLTATQLYQAYAEWCRDTGHKSMSQTRLSGEWQRLNLENYHSGNVSTYKWIGLLSDPIVLIEIQNRQNTP